MMLAGFFTMPESRPVIPAGRVAACGACGLHRGCKSPRMPVSGDGRQGVLVVAEAPGEMEDEQGVQLVGRAGQKLRERLGRIGFDLDGDCWKTNAVCCRPPGNVRPTTKQIAACRPNVLRAIEELKPRVVLLCGAVAVESVVGAVWTRAGGVGEIGRWVGWRVPSGRWNAWVCPTWHPSYLLREEGNKALELLFDRHLHDAFGSIARPWEGGPPDWESQVEPVAEPARAAGMIDRMRAKGGAVAFDFETDRLKPDHPDARIVSCAVCWEGRKTITFPWAGPAAEAMGALLADPGVRKICWGIKFEQRWARKATGRGVAGWDWCGMHAAHVLDNRPGITSLKFQAFTRLGVEPYDADVGPLLRADGGNERNRIDRVDPRRLLIYNGLDALFTWRIAQMQKEEMVAR